MGKRRTGGNVAVVAASGAGVALAVIVFLIAGSFARRADRTVALAFESSPPGAHVREAGKELGVTPFTREVPFDASVHDFELQLEGHAPVAFHRALDRDVVLVAHLRPLPPPEPVEARPQHDDTATGVMKRASVELATDLRKARTDLAAEVDPLPMIVPTFEGGAMSGLALVGVDRWSPAFRAGLRDGDVILAIASHPIRSPSDVRAFVETLAEGNRTLTVLRDDQKLTLDVLAPKK